jgi:hypothetical protein
MIISIINLGLVVKALPYIIQIVEMDVPMDHVSGGEPPEEPEKDTKTDMTGILLVMDPPGRGMGEKNIAAASVNQAIEQKPRSHVENTKKHPQLGILVGIV